MVLEDDIYILSKIGRPCERDNKQTTRFIYVVIEETNQSNENARLIDFVEENRRCLAPILISWQIVDTATYGFSATTDGGILVNIMS